jgi:glutaminyl-peptide cyclotransferase
MRILVAAFALVACSCGPCTRASGGIPEYGYQLIHSYPHDRRAFTDKVYQLTYKNQIGFIFDFETFAKKGEFQYTGQGWSFTTGGKQIYMDGSRDVQAEESDPEIRILDPETLQETGIIKVTADGMPVKNLHELEWVKGEIYANVWQTYKIARIDPKTGKVVGWIDLTGI